MNTESYSSFYGVELLYEVKVTVDKSLPFDLTKIFDALPTEALLLIYKRFSECDQHDTSDIISRIANYSKSLVNNRNSLVLQARRIERDMSPEFVVYVNQMLERLIEYENKARNK